jgi:hypothetical protein
MMNTATQAAASPAPKTWVIWTGRVVSALTALVLFFFGGLALKHPPEMVQGMEKFGWPASAMTLLGTLEIVCALLYLIPQTAFLGAILMTGYFGGAVATHVRIGDPGYPMAIGMACLAWLGLWLRDPRVRQLVPFRRG